MCLDLRGFKKSAHGPTGYARWKERRKEVVWKGEESRERQHDSPAKVERMALLRRHLVQQQRVL